MFDDIKTQFSPELVESFARKIGESGSSVTKAVESFFPLVMSGLDKHLEHHPDFFTSLKEFALGEKGLEVIEGKISDSNDTIRSVAKNIFGNNTSEIINKVTKFSGLNNDTSSSSILNLVISGVLAYIGKYSRSEGCSLGSVKEKISQYSRSLVSLLPQGLSLDYLGINNGFDFSIPGSKKKINGNNVFNYQNNSSKKKKNNWLWWLILLVLLVLIFLGYKSYKKQEVSIPTANLSTEKAVEVAKKLVTFDFNGLKLNGYDGGFEQQMISFLKEQKNETFSEEELKKLWFNFDKFNFEFNSATNITPESVEQLDNLVVILKAFPKAHIKVGSYTDKVGSEEVNFKLSAARAKFVKDHLISKGISEELIATEGYGSKFAKAAASDPESARAKDRKISVRFTK